MYLQIQPEQLRKGDSEEIVVIEGIVVIEEIVVVLVGVVVTEADEAAVDEVVAEAEVEPEVEVCICRGFVWS